MRALQFSRFGPVSDLRLVDLPDPQPDERTAVVKVAAASISPEPGGQGLAAGGRQLVIASTGGRRVSFDLIDFYHNESRLLGIDTRARDAVASASLLDPLVPFFEQGTFRAPQIDRVLALSDGVTAYQEVASGQVHGRVVLAP